MFKDLTPRQLEKLAVGFITSAHLSAGTLLFGQVTSSKPFNLTVAILGILLWIWFYLQAAIIMQMATRRRKAQKPKPKL